MEQKFSISALTVFIALVLIGPSSWAADVFVNKAEGTELSQQQVNDVTNMVKRAVRNMPEHSLVSSEYLADFTLQPSLIQRGDEFVLRIEKYSDGEILAMSEETISSIDPASNRAFAVTETALQEDSFVSDSFSDRGVASDDSRTDALSDDDTVSGTTQADDADQASGGDIRAPSPLMAREDRLGYFQIGFGPAFAVGLESDSIMYNINTSYNIDFSERMTGKVFGDFNLGSGDDSARFINVGAGVDVYPSDLQVGNGRPYFSADLGYGFTRDENDLTKDALAVGAGAGFKFATAQLNMDVSLHYSILTSQIQDENPSVLGLRLAVLF